MLRKDGKALIEPGDLTLAGYMRLIGLAGHHVLIRYDPLRKDCNFTIIIDNQRVTDTDNPLADMAKWYYGGAIEGKGRMNNKKQVDLFDILIGSQGNQIVVRMDFPGAIYVRPLREYCAENRIVWIGGQPWPLSEAISWKFSYRYSNWERFVRWLGERIHCDSLQHFHEEEAFWVDDDGIPRDEWVARLDRIAEQTSPGRCRQILERRY